jgi:probable HAF family extracellular repeat protein
MVDLGTLGGDDSYGYTVNNRGQVVGTSAVPHEMSNNYHAFLYTAADGMVDLNSLIDSDTGWELLDADDINDAGQITGQGLIDDEYHAFLLTPIRELAGDYNDDGYVDAADYTVWRDQVGGDALLNRGAGITGPVGTEDYEVWKRNFGESLVSGTGFRSAGPLSTTAPEPCGFLIALFAAAIISARPRPFTRGEN